jgi:hypothetical protein
MIHRAIKAHWQFPCALEIRTSTEEEIAMRRTIARKKSGHELIAIGLIYAVVLVLLAGLWYVLGL